VSLRRREAIPKLRKEVRSSPVPLDVKHVLRNALEPSPDLRRRSAAPSARSAASPPQRPPLLASLARAGRVDATRASNRAPEPWIGVAGESRRLSPPAAAVGHRSPPSCRSRTFCAVGLRSSVLDQTPPPLLYPRPPQPSDPDPMDLKQPDPVN
jgi:hypothetical protein